VEKGGLARGVFPRFCFVEMNAELFFWLRECGIKVTLKLFVSVVVS